MMSSVAENLACVRRSLPADVTLVAVSKFHPVEALRMAYDAGQRVFGESRVKEMLNKQTQLPEDISWHFIGHLQTNKVRAVVGKVDLIESVDSDRLLRIIDECSDKTGVVSRVLLQVHVAVEETKFGFSPQELVEWFEQGGYHSLKATHICGLMAMASNTPDSERVESDFRQVSALYRHIRSAYPDLHGFDILSMGMSHDYELAVSAGANQVRVGSRIFGDRY